MTSEDALARLADVEARDAAMDLPGLKEQRNWSHHSSDSFMQAHEDRRFLLAELRAARAAARGEPEIERLLEDGRKWRAAEAEGHIVTFSETGYGLQHPPSCRPDLINCPFNTYLAEQDEPGAPPGRYSMYGPLDGIEGPAYAVQP